MAASEALSVPGEGTATAADPEPALDAATVPESSAVPQFRAQLVPIAQLVAVVLGVFAIIWNQQQSIDSLRTELRAEISAVKSELGAEIAGVESGLRAEIAGLSSEVSANGQRLARIEGFLGIGTPDAPAIETPGLEPDGRPRPAD